MPAPTPDPLQLIVNRLRDSRAALFEIAGESPEHRQRIDIIHKSLEDAVNMAIAIGLASLASPSIAKIRGVTAATQAPKETPNA